jgi:hypothetical protein
MFEGKKTTTFYVGLVALGFGINYLCFLFYQIISILFLSIDRDFISASLLGSSIPQITSSIIFLAIGLYVMSKGVAKEPIPSTGEIQ